MYNCNQEEVLFYKINIALKLYRFNLRNENSYQNKEKQKASSCCFQVVLILVPGTDHSEFCCLLTFQNCAGQSWSIFIQAIKTAVRRAVS